MKKTTFYTLLCTTIILPGALLAADQVNTPIRAEGERQKSALRAQMKSKADLKKEEELKYQNVVLTPDTKSDYVARGVAQAEREQRADVLQKLQAVDIATVQKRLARDLDVEETKRKDQEKEHEALILKSREEAAQNEELEKKVTELTDAISVLNLRINNKTESQKLSRDEIETLNKELETKTEELMTAQKELAERKANEKLLGEQIKTEREGKERLQAELKARGEKKDAGNAGGGAQAVQGVLPQGGGQVVINNGPQVDPVNGGGQPTGVQPVKTGGMKLANFGARGEDKK